jgi:hypothetical protein
VRFIDGNISKPKKQRGYLLGRKTGMFSKELRQPCKKKGGIIIFSSQDYCADQCG